LFNNNFTQQASLKFSEILSFLEIDFFWGGGGGRLERGRVTNLVLFLSGTL
jgi:hypothetical protein